MAAFLDLTTDDIGTPFSLRGQTTPVIGSNTLASFTVPAGKLLLLKQLNSSSQHPGRIELTNQGSQVTSFRLNAAIVSYQTFYSPNERIAAGQEIIIKFFAMGGQEPSDIEWGLTGLIVDV